MQDFCTHNYETFIREIKENQNERRDMPCLSIRKFLL